MTVCYFGRKTKIWIYVPNVKRLGGEQKTMLLIVGAMFVLVLIVAMWTMVIMVLIQQIRSVIVCHVNPTVLPSYTLAAQIVHDREHIITSVVFDMKPCSGYL